MRSRVLFALFLLSIAAAALAAPVTVRGTIVTPDGTTPYPDVEVTVNGQTVYTDAAGDFFVRLEPGTYDVKVKTSRSETMHRITVAAQPAPVKLAVK